MSKFGRNELAVGFLVLGALALLTWMSTKIGALRGLGDQIDVTATFESVAGLSEGASVQVAGVPVGRVAWMEVVGGRAKVHLELEQEAKLRTDARAQIRARSLLGEKYVELVPGGDEAPLLEDGAELSVGREPVELDEFVTDLSPVVHSVDPAALSELIRALTEVYKDDPERMKRVAADLEIIVHNMALASQDAPALVSEARSTMAELRSAAREARPVIRRADAMVASAEEIVARLPATVDEVHALASDGRGAVAEGRAMLSKVDGSLDEVQVVLDNLAEIDRWELRRIVREEGITVRLRPRVIVPDDASVAGATPGN